MVSPSASIVTSKLSFFKIVRISSVGTVMPRMALIALTRAVKCLPSRGAPAEQSNSVAVTSPQPSSWIRCRARAMPSSVVYSLMPFS